jgi:phosphoglycolate phosphatase
MLSHIIFDLDGTLVDSSVVCLEILSGMLTDRGSDHVIDPVSARAYMSRGGIEMVAALLGPACGNPTDELTEFRARDARKRTLRKSLFPGVVNGLRRFYGSGLALSICSNKPQNLCEQVINDTGIANLFSAVVGGRPDCRAKPAPDLLDATLSELRTHPGECIYVGDSELDWQVARDAGMPFVFMTYGYASDRMDDVADYTFDCFTEMTESLLSVILRRSAA